MTDWQSYINEKEPEFKRKKSKGPGCKKNKINKQRFGPCIFSEQEECIYCKRPRRKEVRLDSKTNKVITTYLE